MPQQEFIPKSYSLEHGPTSTSSSVHLRSNERNQAVDFTFEAIRPGLFRTTFTSDTHPLPPFPSAARPKAHATTYATTKSGANSKTFTYNDIEATVDWSGVPIVSVGFAGQQPLHTDLPNRSYVLDGSGVAHYTRYFGGSLHVGLGEKAAPMDLSNRHFTLSATDSFGYDVHRTDPMYKHIPLLIRAGPEGVVATFSASHSRGHYSVGSEMDGMWGFFKVYRQDHGGLEQYILIGKTLQEVITIYADLVGYPLLVPRWAFGYLGGGMKYSMLDEPRASDALLEWASKLEKHDIPCSGFQMSSGYTVAETEPKTRNVFTWNRHRFPDPKSFCDAFHAKGIRLIANIKPYILGSHPEYEKLVKAGALFKDLNTGGSGIARLWSAGGGESGEGGHIDFTSKAGYDFWYNGVKELRQIGMDCMWNDNNEYVVPDDTWQLSLDQESVKDIKEPRSDLGLWGRAMHTELHGKASHDALLEVRPDERPFVLTRSATAGTMKYSCSSWSGDNITSWDGMRGANALSLTAGMCLMQCYGHDIGGFEGPQPTPELLLRWIQLGIHSPRFAINCYKTGDDNLVGDVIEPWMYPEIIPEVRKAIRRLYELIPYRYSLMLQSHLTAMPPQRWVGWGYESDPEVWTSRVLKDGEQQYWLGDSLLVGGVYAPGATEGKIYAPKRSASDPGFLNLSAPYQYLPAGQWHAIASPWKNSIPLLAKIGGAIPVGKNKQVVASGDKINEAKLPADDWRGLEIFPAPEHLADGTVFSNIWLEDDGISPPPARIAKFTLSYAASATEVRVSFEIETGVFLPPWVENGLTIILPVGDSRPVISSNGRAIIEARRQDETGRRRYHILGEDQSIKGRL
ncbi:Alpha-glucosidase 2 [Fulvia fulva]|uniref:alpha-glucosidase n=1 Tax=Passalora fulva TaxID=5499 RepID=A0A9Q8L8D4_PASFU|nr:Alpha-glucosidase 2 [Fulvia fulva]KAK4634063.1 Alpha-glucosidase 2 [Fulvia fulva]KAK4637371.1 Alpha-glucosidase 2 [Fulvia fulva]UJO12672.1 Alpha-glucosidase 2 [Fulvia fulva]WPV09190.1 Alpha-glucosidase 2 [Fulvia fulva]WPV23382.1 Alpha-glucosidase 2 [Fulvia fulva]